MEWEVAKLINAVLDSDFGALARGRLSGYLYDQLSTLNTQLDIEVFEQVLHVIHQRILQKFLDVVLGDIDVMISFDTLMNDIEVIITI